MAEEILSQEEIDALLSAMASGDVDLEKSSSSEAEVIAYDLTSKSVILNDQFKALEEVFIKFTNDLQTAITTSMKKPFEVKFVSSEMIKYKDFIKSFSYPTGFNIVTMDPLIGSAMVVLEPNLIFSLIDCMFGGNGKPLEKERELTRIDQRMMKKVVDEILNQFSNAWTSIMPIHPQLKKVETRPEFVHLVPPEDFVITNNFEINTTEFSGLLHVCISYLMLEPIKDKLSAAYLNEKDSDHVWNVQLQRLLKKTDVTIIAELGRTACTINDLLNLRIDDVIKLGTGPEDYVRVNIENMPKFSGYPGILKGNRAVQIVEAGTRNERKLSNGLGIQ